MATRTITTKLALDGEKEFKRQLSEVNSNLRTMRSEMDLVDAEFKGNANTLDALTKKNELLRKEQEQQLEKVRALEQAVSDAAEAYGESDKRTDSYRQQLNRAKKELLEMNEAVEKNEKYLDEAKKSANQCATSIDGFGKEVKGAKNGVSGFAEEVDDAGDELDEFGESAKGAGNALGGSGGMLSKLKDLKGVLVGGAIVMGAKAASDAIIGVVEDTKEYRQILGTLEVSSQKAGYTTEQTAEAYEYLNGVLGDTQAAATTVANLQAIGLEQEDLMETINAVIGAWATYGDSIPIDGLAEAINETIQTSKVTGTFADVLNWAGESEDAFNEKLEAANSTAERAQMVMDVLANQGLADAGEKWREVNSDVVEYNEAQEKANQAMAELGERLTPVAAGLKTTFAGAMNVALDAVEGLVDAVKDAINWLNKLGNAQSESAAAHTGRNSSGRNNERSSANVTRDALTGESEVKSSRSTASTTSSTQQTINITVKTDLDGKTVAKTVTKYQSQNERART